MEKHRQQTKVTNCPADELRHPARPNNVPREPHKIIDWFELADYFVSFGYSIDPSAVKTLQTKVHLSQTGESAEWNGIAKNELWDWMLCRAKLDPPAETQVEAETIDSRSRSSVNSVDLMVSDFQISEIETPVLIRHRLYSSAVKVEFRIVLYDVLREIAGQRLQYILELQLVNLRTHRTVLVSIHSDYLRADNLVYEIVLTFPPPGKGTYQFYISAQLPPPYQTAVRLEGPVFQVAPQDEPSFKRR